MTADAVGGVWTYALELARTLAWEGVEIALATMGGAVSGRQHEELATLPNVRLYEHTAKLEWMDNPWADVDEAGRWLLGLAADFEPDMVHLNGFCHAALPWDAPVLVVAHSCVLSWWAAVRDEPAPARYDEYRRRVRAGLAAADEVVAPTAAMLAALECYGAVLPRQRVIYNGRDPERFAPGRKEPRILSAGRAWDEAKNMATLDLVAPSLRWPISVAGDQTHPDGSAATLANVHVLGKLSPAELAAQLATCAIYALPARYEPFGLSALEAGLCGCALVLGDLPSLREVWGDAAVFVDLQDERALADTLNALIEDDARRAELGRRARVRALEYSPAAMAEGYRAAYVACRTRQAERIAG